jgi:8-oxo-dGTP diphosphatase
VLGPVDVAVAILRRDGDGRILARRRRPDEKLAGLWEFPGGKVEAGETPAEAVAREVLEEMGGSARGLAPLRVLEHDYPDRRVRIHVFEGMFTDEPAPPDGAAWAWLTPLDLARLPIPPANREIVDDLVADTSRSH